jgi:hypothetical protein
VLEVSTRPHDPAHPVVCLDETSRQLLAEVRPTLAPAAGQPRREDPEYARQGVVNVFVVGEPLRGWRQVRVSEQRTRRDWAAWTATRHVTCQRIAWRFTTADSRIKLKRLYPAFEV